MLLWCSQSFWYFEDKVYCSFDKSNVTLFLKQEGNLAKCSVYLDTIEQLAVKRYNEILLIRSYIAQWDDVYYWKNVLEDKKNDFLKLVNYMTQIKWVIDDFETAFFDKYHAVLQSSMQLYYSDLETQYYILINDTSKNRDMIKISEYEQQMRNVSQVINAKNLDEIMNVLSSYVYLKQRLSWK